MGKDLSRLNLAEHLPTTNNPLLLKRRGNFMYIISKISVGIIIITIVISGCSSQYMAPRITDNNRPVVAWAPLHKIVIKSDGTLWGYGDNSCGQLGFEQDSPKIVTALTRIGADNDWVTVSTAEFHTMAIKKDGTLWGWGSNDHQQLGFNEVTGGIGPAVPAPKQLGTDTDWKIVSCGFACTFAIKTNGTLWAWGYDGGGVEYSGQFISKQPEVTVPPTRVGSDTDWAGLVELFPHSSPSPTVIKTDGSLWTWKEDRQYLINSLTGKAMPWRTYWIDVEAKTVKMPTRINSGDSPSP
jgi:alpha-tubulin suppressor-like RCC1 family protein